MKKRKIQHKSKNERDVNKPLSKIMRWEGEGARGGGDGVEGEKKKNSIIAFKLKFP